MKKTFFSLNIIFLMFSIAIFGQQSTSGVFRIEDSQNNKVLFHNLDTNTAEAPLKTTTFLNSEEGYLESFIFKPVPGEFGKLYIVSAKDPSYFLAKEIDNIGQVVLSAPVIFKKFSELEDSSFQWEILVGDEKKMFTTEIDVDVFLIGVPELKDAAIRLNSQGIFKVEKLITASGTLITTANDVEIIHPDFQFYLRTNSNTL